MYGSTQFWESFMWIHVTWVHHIWACCAKGSEIVDMDVWGREYHACYILVAVVWCSNKMPGADPGTLYELGLHPKCPHKGKFLPFCTVYMHSILVMNSRLKMQTVLLEWLSSRMRVSTEVHLSRRERMAMSSFSVCCFHTCPFILVLVLVKVKLGAQSYGYILSFCGEILGHYIWTLHEIKMFDHRALYLSQNAQIWLQITTHRSAQ